MKLSISLPDDDVEFLDQYATRAGAESRSSIVHEAIALLRSASLEDEYVEAWDEWDASEDARLWDTTVSDGITDASR